jgi:hypothetical protein
MVALSVVARARWNRFDALAAMCSTKASAGAPKKRLALDAAVTSPPTASDSHLRAIAQSPRPDRARSTCRSATPMAPPARDCGQDRPPARAAGLRSARISQRAGDLIGRG